MKPLATLLLTSVFLAGSVAYAHGPSDTWNTVTTLSRVSALIRNQVLVRDVMAQANDTYVLSKASYQNKAMTPATKSARCGSSLLQRRSDPPCTMFPDQELKPL